MCDVESLTTKKLIEDIERDLLPWHAAKPFKSEQSIVRLKSSLKTFLLNKPLRVLINFIIFLYNNDIFTYFIGISVGLSYTLTKLYEMTVGILL